MKYRFHKNQPIRWPRRRLQKLAQFCVERAKVYGKQGDSEKCMKYLNWAHQYDPTNLEYLWIIANYWYENDDEKAIDPLNRIIEIGGDLWAMRQAHHKRAISYDPLGKPEKVIEDLDWLIRHGFEDAGNYQWRGKCRLALGNADGAIEDFSVAVQRSPQSHSCLINRAWAYYQLKRYEEVLQDLDLFYTTFGLGTFREWFYTLRGKVYFQLGRHQDALNDFNSGTGLSKPFTDATAYMETYFPEDLK
jgi:tetratricopeptide (TPR) repeat protein